MTSNAAVCAVAPSRSAEVQVLTGACLRMFGTEVAGVLGNDEAVIAQVRQAGAPHEPVGSLPMIRYRNQLDSGIAGMTDPGGPNAGSITAALFLQELVDGTPRAHIDIAGTARAVATTRWIPKGPTGFGGRLLVELALVSRRCAERRGWTTAAHWA